MADFLGELLVKISADDSNLVGKIQGADAKLKKFGDNAKRIGGTLTRNLSLPLAALGVVALKFASDLEESFNAVSVVFGEATDQIVEFGSTAATSLGLAQSEFNAAAVVLGSALQNAGFSADFAAEKTIELTTRAADMASVFNTDVDQALGAIQAALRGEIDPIERFGVGLSAVTVEAKALELGLADSKDEITAYAKTQARLALIMEQTDKVAGDFANTADSTANSLRIAKAQAIDLAAEFGEKMLPTINKVIAAVREMLGRFGDLTDEQQENIIKMAALVAAVGPVISVIGTMTTVVRGLTVALAFLAANPVVAVVAALAGVAVGIGVLVKKIEETRNAKLDEEFAAIAEEVGLAGHEIERATQAFITMTNAGATAGEAVKRIAEGFDISEDAAIRILETNEDISERFSEQIAELKEMREIIAINEDLTVERLEDEKAMVRELEAQAVVLDEIAGKLEERLALETAIPALVAAENAGLITAEESIERRISLREAERNALIDTIETQGELTAQERQLLVDINSLLVSDRLALEALNTERQAGVFLLDGERNALQSMFDTEVLSRTELEELRDEFHQNQLERIEEENEKRRDQINTAADVAGQIAGVFSMFSDNRFEAERQRIQALEDGELASAEEIDKQRRKLAHDEAVAKKNQTLFDIALDTARGIAAALPNPIAMAFAAAIGAAQALAVETRPLPKLAEGGFFNGAAVIGEQGPEVAVPLSGPQGSNAMAAMADGIVAAMQRNGNTTNNSSSVTVNNLISLGNQNEMTEAARRLFPFMEKEAQRRGVSMVRG